MPRCALVVATGGEPWVIGSSITAGRAAVRMSNFSIVLAYIKHQIGQEGFDEGFYFA